MVHDQDSAVIMIAYSTCSVYAICNSQVLGKESSCAPRMEVDLRGRLKQSGRGQRGGHRHRRVACLPSAPVLQALDILLPDALE